LAEPLKTIAVLVANPALGSVLSMVLASSPAFRVRPFETELALLTYMRLAPVDLIVADFDSESDRADLVTRRLRAETTLERPEFQVIALASAVNAETKNLCIAAGIDEVIVKPMSPKYLLERVQARLRRNGVVNAGYRPARTPVVARLAPRPDFSQYSNVIPLFGRRPAPQH
jgi:DNA-binding response OmpR family regulator